MVFMIEKLLALAPKSTNRQLHFFVPFNFGVYLFLSVLQILIKIQNTSTCNIKSKDGIKNISEAIKWMSLPIALWNKEEVIFKYIKHIPKYFKIF